MNGSLAYRFIGTTMLTLCSGLSLLACEESTTTTPTSSSTGSDGGNGGNGSGGGGGGSGGGSNTGSNGAKYADAHCGLIFNCCNAADLAAQLLNS